MRLKLILETTYKLLSIAVLFESKYLYIKSINYEKTAS